MAFMILRQGRQSFLRSVLLTMKINTPADHMVGKCHDSRGNDFSLGYFHVALFQGVYQVREVREFTLSLEKSGNLVKSRGKVREFHRNQGIFF